MYDTSHVLVLDALLPLAPKFRSACGPTLSCTNGSDGWLDHVLLWVGWVILMATPPFPSIATSAVTAMVERFVIEDGRSHT
mmetsp:Transcript_13544/g.24475  ORF Transcript_13544/g.24475 Transcript_13544/m.24475 type:complete len:81 (+) Transcript_13544:487-729(+)